MPHRIFIGLGSNLGNRLDYIQQALKALPPEIKVLRSSQIYETPAWGYTDQPPFLNQVVEAQTELDPEALLAKLKSIEEQLGRVANFRYGPRCIDLDILFFDDLIYQSVTLNIPHPSLPQRAFVLVPLNEIAPNLLHPGLNQKISELVKKTDAAGIKIYEERNR